MSEQCAKCGSREIVPRALVLDQGSNSDMKLKTAVETKPSALIFRRPVMSSLFARICGECGFVELFVDDPRAIYDAYLKAEQEVRDD